MINKYPDIDKLFGTPINDVPRPKIPFKPKTWHYVAGIALAGLAVYGGYTLVKKVKGNDKKHPDLVPRYPTPSFKQKVMVDVPLPNADAVETTEPENDE